MTLRASAQAQFWEKEYDASMATMWSEARHRVWIRDDFTCQGCGADARKYEGQFHVHHIVTREHWPLHFEPSNLVLLCHTCHKWVHSRGNTESLWLGSPVGPSGEDPKKIARREYLESMAPVFRERNLNWLQENRDEVLSTLSDAQASNQLKWRLSRLKFSLRDAKNYLEPGKGDEAPPSDGRVFSVEGPFIYKTKSKYKTKTKTKSKYKVKKKYGGSCGLLD